MSTLTIALFGESLAVATAADVMRSVCDRNGILADIYSLNDEVSVKSLLAKIQKESPEVAIVEAVALLVEKKALEFAGAMTVNVILNGMLGSKEFFGVDKMDFAGIIEAKDMPELGEDAENMLYALHAFYKTAQQG